MARIKTNVGTRNLITLIKLNKYLSPVEFDCLCNMVILEHDVSRIFICATSSDILRLNKLAIFKKKKKLSYPGEATN